MKFILAGLGAAASFLLCPGATFAQAQPAQATGTGVVVGQSAQPLPAPVVTKPPVNMPVRVLFVGNSLMYSGGGFQTQLHRLAASIDPKYKVLDAGYKSVHITGATLEPYPVDYLTKPGDLGIKKPFQLALLASSAREPMTVLGPANYRNKVIEWSAAMKKYGGKIAVIWLPAAVKPNWNEDAYHRNGEVVINTANAVGAYVIPIAPAFREAYRLRPDIKLQEGYDGYHPTDAGQYLWAAVAFDALYGRSPVGSDYTYFGAIDKSTAAFLQKVAADTVRQFYGN
jgi:hypothetical protein